MLEVCARCTRERRPGEYACPGCDGDFYVSRVEGSSLQGQETSDDTLETFGILAPLLRLSASDLVLLYGRKGSGKTTVAMSMLANPWVCTREMRLDQVRRYARRFGIKLAGISQPVLDENGDWNMDVPEDHVGPVVLDSLTACGGDPLLVIAALRVVQGRSGNPLVVVSQTTKDGTPWGTERIPHEADVIVELSTLDGRRQASLEKNRGGELGSVWFEIDAGGARPPLLERFYSVEGTAPSYRLVAWPSDGRLADPYRDAEKDEEFRTLLGKPPLALAARRTELYRSGYAEPEDATERRAFAARMGLDWWTPGRGRVRAAPASSSAKRGKRGK